MSVLDSLRRRTSFALAVAALVALGAGPAQSAIQFTNVSSEVGFDQDFYAGPTVHNLGLVWADVNNDDLPDLFVVNGFGLPEHLYRNRGNGQFAKVDNVLPVLANVEMSGAVFADYDNDGDQDIYIFASNEQFSLDLPNDHDGPVNMLLKNMFVENGNAISSPLFVEVAASAGVDNAPAVPLGVNYNGHRSMTGGFLDADRDGCIDLYVGNMTLQAAGLPANQDFFYRNNCDGTFTDDTANALPDSSDPTNLRPALAFVGAHLDDDLWPDMYVVNVHEASPHHHDFIYQNNGDGTFTDITGNSPGVGDDAGSGMGLDVADIDLDGDWDIYISDVFDTVNDALPLGNAFYLNNGDGTWSDNSAPAAGLEAEFSWAINFFDADHDGYEDVFVGTGSAPYYFYQNNQDGTFTWISDQLGFVDDAHSRGAGIADYDRDGDMDFAVVNITGELELFRNDTTDAGNWLEIQLEATSSNLTAIGTLVKTQAGALNMMRQVTGGNSTHSQSDRLIHFGLADNAEATEVRIFWPSGAVDLLTNVTANQLVVVTEGQSDTDGDGVPDVEDNCPDNANSDQADADGDSIGDVCDPTPFPVSIDLVQPRVLIQGATVDITVRGTGFAAGGQARLVPPAGMTINSVTVQSETQLVINLSVGLTAPLGERGILFRNLDGSSARKTRAVRVVPAP